MTSWPDWIKIIQLKPRFLFGIWLLGIVILFMPPGSAEKFGVDHVRTMWLPWLGLGTLSAFSFWLVQLIPYLQSFRARLRNRTSIVRSLDSISPEEWLLIVYCLERNQQTINLSVIDSRAGSLVARGVLLQAAGVGNQLAWPYMIPTFLWNHLLKHRDQFMRKFPFSRAEIETQLLSLHHKICQSHY